jgi:hypothetical protein
MLGPNVKLGLRWPFALVRQRRHAHVTEFLDPTRSYDGTRLAVRFYGYDGSIEASFFVTQDSLSKLAGRDVVGKSEGLSMFDANRARI